ncbi:hypothetical protein BB561_002295 [Smittium simulii]|uniref:E3 ubiquitin protein ligase n=1 Tax=Smittium simulii TaxID=133385 RepID=A0A2T9YQY3_9FUNG|nr:hypothetical protein BB561_002295 [Smittium simulii]
MTERKRSLETDTKMQDDVAILSKKKRNREDDKAIQVIKEFDDNLEQMIDMENIRNFQKEAIWRQMNEYKRESLRDKAKVKEVEEKQRVWAERIGRMCAIWEGTSEKLKNSLPDSVEWKKLDSNESRWIRLIFLEKGLYDNSLQSLEEINDPINNLQTKTKDLCSLYELIVSKFSDENFDIKADKFTLKNYDDSDYFKLQSQLDISELQLNNLKKNLDEREEELLAAQKKFDRSLCPISRALDSGKSIDSIEEPETPSKKIDIPQSDSQNTNQIEVASLQKIADGRLIEIKRLSEECTKLKLEIDKINIGINSYSKEHISNHPEYIKLESEKNHYYADTIQQRTETKKLFAELEELKASRRTYQAHLQTQEIAQRQVLEQSLQKVQQDLMRVRSHRDQIQRELEERRMHDSVEKNGHLELQTLSDARRQRLIALVLENRRLRAHIASSTGDEKAVDFYTNPPITEDISVTEELRLEIDKLKQKLIEIEPNSINYLKENINSCGIQTDNNKSISHSDINFLNSNGINPAHTKENSSNDSLNKSLPDTKELLRIALLEKEELEKTSSLMEHEMQAIISGFSKLEEQVTHKVLNLSSKEQMIHKLIAEKAKYEEKFLALNKEREALKGTLSSLKFQNMKQLEHIKNSDERERNLNQQLALLEQHLLGLRLDQAKCMESLQDANNSIETLKSQLNTSEKTLQSTMELLKARTSDAEKSSYELAREKESLIQLQHKVEALESSRINANDSSNFSGSNNGNLTELVDQYKALLKCSTCRRNFKNYALTRCMHVFCKECIDARIETRQRKCPTCSEPFGLNDVKQIFL